MPHIRWLLLSLTLPLAACSWGIKLDSAGSKIRTAWNTDVSACQERGQVTVSVLDRMGPVGRSTIKVNDELEIMARNEAAKLGADTIKPLGEVRDGEQSWGAYVCGTRLPEAREKRRDNPSDQVETFPIQ